MEQMLDANEPHHFKVMLLKVVEKHNQHRVQSWSISVFYSFSIIKNDFLHFLPGLFDWEWAF